MVTSDRWARVGAMLDIYLQGLKRMSIFVFQRREAGSSRQLSLAPGFNSDGNLTAPRSDAPADRGRPAMPRPDGAESGGGGTGLGPGPRL